VRMGVHTDTVTSYRFDPMCNQHHYSGPLLNTARAISDVGVGGQTVITQATLSALQSMAHLSSRRYGHVELLHEGRHFVFEPGLEDMCRSGHFKLLLKFEEAECVGRRSAGLTSLEGLGERRASCGSGRCYVPPTPYNGLDTASDDDAGPHGVPIWQERPVAVAQGAGAALPVPGRASSHWSQRPMRSPHAPKPLEVASDASPSHDWPASQPLQPPSTDHAREVSRSLLVSSHAPAVTSPASFEFASVRPPRMNHAEATARVAFSASPCVAHFLRGPGVPPPPTSGSDRATLPVLNPIRLRPRVLPAPNPPPTSPRDNPIQAPRLRSPAACTAVHDSTTLDSPRGSNPITPLNSVSSQSMGSHFSMSSQDPLRGSILSTSHTIQSDSLAFGDTLTCEVCCVSTGSHLSFRSLYVASLPSLL
jgi:hypothetical protein